MLKTEQERDSGKGIAPSRISQRWIRIIPVALIMYTIAFIDRTNISLALPKISRDLHLDPQQTGTIAGVFFLGYLALQIPGGHLANHNMTTTLLHHQPKTGLEAKFSMEFCLAILLVERKAGLGEFSEKVVHRPDVQEMIRRINFYVDPEAESAGFDKMTSILKIYLKDGRVIAGRADFAKGSPANPMTFEEAATKFRGCAEYAGCSKSKSEKIIAFVRTLDSVPDVDVLAPLWSVEKG